MDSDSESKLISLFFNLSCVDVSTDSDSDGEPDLDLLWESKIIPLIIQIISLVMSMDLDSQPKPESKLMSLVSQAVSLFSSMDMDSLPKSLSELISFISQKISSDSDQKPDSDLKLRLLVEETLELKPDPELVSLVRQIVSVVEYMETDLKDLISLCPQVEVFLDEDKHFVTREVSWMSKGKSKWDCFLNAFSLFTLTGEEETHFHCESCNGEYHNEYEKAPLEITHFLHQEHSLQLVLIQGRDTRECYCCDEVLIEVFYFCSACDFGLNIACVEKPPRQAFLTLHLKKLYSLISQLMNVEDGTDSEWKSKIMSLIIQMIFLVRSMDLEDSQPKPETKLMSLVTQTVSYFNSMDFDSLPKPLSKLISLFSQTISIVSDQKHESDSKLKSLSRKEFVSIDDLDQQSNIISLIYQKSAYQKEQSDLNFRLLVEEALELKPEPELISLIRQTVSFVISTKNLNKFILLSPRVQVSFNEGKVRVEPWKRSDTDTWNCLVGSWELISLTRKDRCTHFFCRSCNGEYHNDNQKTPVEIKHPLHRRHSLQLAFNKTFDCESSNGTRECYCCDEDLIEVFYFCSACDFSMNIACVEKPRVLSVPLSKWHEHPLALFPRKTSLTCDLCALATSSSPFYICPPCDFVAHQKCINLPRVLRISRHPHRIRYTPSFEEGDWYCGVCRRKIDNDYGGYSCVRDGCSYAAHSRCATQRNVWDGIDLEGEPEEIEEEVAEPFVRISDGIIQHFTHERHHLRLDENTCRDYDDNKLCQACVTPIYFGNFYSCLQCEFVLHETCAHLSRKIYHPIHPHLLTLAMDNTNGRYYTPKRWKSTSKRLLLLSPMGNVNYSANRCSACHQFLTAGFFYECGKDCDFRLHMQCAVISEPLVHRCHVHPLFLTSKPEEIRSCNLCQTEGGPYDVNETFNCIDECNDDFALCFRCATLPQKLRYKHDKHILSLSYGEEMGTVTYWCEACEGKINPKEGFYMCDEYCCVTLHVECLIGCDLYMKPGSSFHYDARDRNIQQVSVQSNNHQTRPICTGCEKRCAHKIHFQCCFSELCSLECLHYFCIERIFVY